MWQWGTAVTNIKAGVRHLGCVTYNGSNLAIYIDGVLGAVGGSITANISGSGLSGIGTDSISSDPFDGSIEEVMIISEVITQPVVGQYYAWATKKKRGFWENSSWSLLNFLRTLSDSMMNAASRFATVAFTKRFVAALAATIMNAASRFTTLAGNLLILVRNVSVTMMNAASRLATLTGTITKYVAALSVSMMNSASRLATLFGQQMKYIANLSVSMMNSVSRFVVLTTGNAKILVVNMMNAAGRLTTLFSQQMLFIRNLTVNMMYAVNRLTSFLVTIPGTWAFRAKNLTSWAFRSKNNTSWTFRTKNPPGAEKIPSEPN